MKDEVEDMRYEEMNEREKKAFRNIVNATDWVIGELENTASDNEGTEFGDNAQALLNDHEALVKEIYERAISEVFDGCGGNYFGARAEQMLKDIRFCGTEWLMERVDRRVTKMGY